MQKAKYRTDRNCLGDQGRFSGGEVGRVHHRQMLNFHIACSSGRGSSIEPKFYTVLLD
jgi:hypothetical protein